MTPEKRFIEASRDLAIATKAAAKAIAKREAAKTAFNAAWEFRAAEMEREKCSYDFIKKVWRK